MSVTEPRGEAAFRSLQLDILLLIPALGLAGGAVTWASFGEFWTGAAVGAGIATPFAGFGIFLVWIARRAMRIG